MSKFIWRDDYKIGNDLVDGQHQHLFKLANHIFEAQDKDTMIHYSLELFRYIRKHFKDEERLMRQLNFPDFEKHAKAHDEILKRLTNISIHCKNDEFTLAELKILMNDWLLIHIQKEDRLIGEFARKTIKAT
jgi:hemerythrin